MDPKIKNELTNLCGERIFDDHDIQDLERDAFQEIVLTQCINGGRQGDGWSILRHIVKSHHDSKPIRTDAIEFLVLALEKILDGEKAEKALLLHKGPGNKSNCSHEMSIRDFVIFSQVKELMEDGRKFEEAVHEVACKLRPEEPFTAEDNVARIYKKGRNVAKKF